MEVCRVPLHEQEIFSIFFNFPHGGQVLFFVFLIRVGNVCSACLDSIVLKHRVAPFPATQAIICTSISVQHALAIRQGISYLRVITVWPAVKAIYWQGATTLETSIFLLHQDSAKHWAHLKSWSFIIRSLPHFLIFAQNRFQWMPKLQLRESRALT